MSAKRPASGRFGIRCLPFTASPPPSPILQAESATELAKLMQSKQITLFVSQELTQEPNLVAVSRSASRVAFAAHAPWCARAWTQEALQAMRGHEQQVSKGAASTAESDVGAR